MSKEQITLEQRALNGLANFIIMHGNNDDYDASAIEWHGILKIALEHAKKEHELLELYKRLFNVCKEYKCASIGLSDDSEFLNVMSELENKLSKVGVGD